VARFPGLSAELRGRVLDGGRGAELVRIQIGNGEELPARAGWPPLPGQSVEALVRPAAVGLTAPDDPVASLQGEIADSAFRGRACDHLVRPAGGALLTEVLARSHRRGEAVGLQIDPAGCLIYTLVDPTPLQLETARAGLESSTVSGGRRSGPRQEERETMRMTPQGRID
jgi:TOBE domain